MSNLNHLLKQAQKLQKDMENAKKELETMEVTGESGGGLVKLCTNGRHEAKWIKIDSAALDEDKEVLEDLIVAAINDAVKKVMKVSTNKMAGFAAAMGLPADQKDME